LKPQRADVLGRKTLVLDLDETLVHSSFKQTKQPDIVLPVDIEGRVCHVYILVRPGCAKFLTEMAKYYEVVIFTASLSKYANPLMDIIDPNNTAPQRLFREHCTFSNSIFVKDMTRLGRPMKDVFIIDNSPLSYSFQPENGMPILSWYEEKTDNKLLELIPVLKLLSQVDDVRPVLTECCSRDNVYLCQKSLKMCDAMIKEERQEELQYQKQEQKTQAYSKNDQSNNNPNSVSQDL
jgi:RNA polymerase II subunit A small phosphatase-like protein